MGSVLSVALLAGGCAPRAKPIGYVGGTALAITGIALMADAASTDCTPEEPQPPIFNPEPLACGLGALGEGALGGLATLTGLVILAVALASPGAPEPAAAQGAAPPPAPAPASAPADAPAGEEDPLDMTDPANWPRAMQIAPRRSVAAVRLGFD